MFRGLATVVSALLVAEASFATDVLVGLDWNPARSDGVEARPSVRFDGALLPGTRTEDGWLFKLPPQDRLLAELEIMLESGTHEGYEFDSLTVGVPFSQSSVEAYVVPIKVDTSAPNVRRLFATDPREKHGRELFSLYQEIRAVARARIKEASAGTGIRAPSSRVRDVQAVYKLLETAYVISKRTPVLVARDVESSYRWLIDTSKMHAGTVEDALAGFDEHADQILADISQLESIPYTSLWREISDRDCNERKIVLIEQFYMSRIRALESDCRKRIVDVIGVNRIVAENDANECAAEIAKRPLPEGKEAVELDARMQILARRTDSSGAAIDEYSKAYGGDFPGLDQLATDRDYLRSKYANMKNELELKTWFSPADTNDQLAARPRSDPESVGPAAVCFSIADSIELAGL